MQPSTELARPQIPAVQIYISGRSLIRLYVGNKCVGFSETYKFAQIRAEEIANAGRQQGVH
jgi:hypothetical protein